MSLQCSVFRLKESAKVVTLLFCLQGVHKLIMRQTSHANDFVNAKSRSVKAPKIGVGRMTLNGEKHGDSSLQVKNTFLRPYLFLEKMERTKPTTF